MEKFEKRGRNRSAKYKRGSGGWRGRGRPPPQFFLLHSGPSSTRPALTSFPRPTAAAPIPLLPASFPAASLFPIRPSPIPFHPRHLYTHTHSHTSQTALPFPHPLLPPFLSASSSFPHPLPSHSNSSRATTPAHRSPLHCSFIPSLPRLHSLIFLCKLNRFPQPPTPPALHLRPPSPTGRDGEREKKEKEFAKKEKMEKERAGGRAGLRGGNKKERGMERGRDGGETG